MNEDANDIFKSLMAKANRNLISECAELREKLQAAEDSAELGRQLTKAYSKLSDGYLAQAQAYDDLNRLYMESVKRAEAAEARVDNLWKHSKAAQARILELNRELDAEISEKTARIIEESNRADAAEARVKELEQIVARQQGGAK